MGLQYARKTTREGRVLSAHQTVQLRLSEMQVLTEALRSFVLRTAWERELASQPGVKSKDYVNAQLVMIFAKSSVQRVTQLNVDLHRAVGAMDEAADKLARDAAIWTHLAGSTLLNIIAAKVLING
jgi:alkylation response protein AidB-like acyl-CoA dehydrogenase